MFRSRRKESEAVTQARQCLDGNPEEAARMLTRAVQADSRDVLARYYLAVAQFKLIQIAEMKATLLNLLSNKELDEEILELVAALVGNRRLVSERYFNSAPTFSHSGRHVVVSSARKDTNGDGRINAMDRCGIYLVDVLSAEERCLVPDDHYSFMASLSPDGQYLLYLGVRRDVNKDGEINYLDNAGIYLLELKTGIEHCLVTDEYFNKYPSFSPDGRKVIYTSWRNAYDRSGLYLLDLETGRETQVVSDRFDNAFPTFCPDGQKVFYTTWRNDTNDDGKIDFRDNSAVYMVDLRSHQEQELVSDRYNNFFPACSPDGERLVYLSRRRDTNGDGHIDSLDNCGIYSLGLESRREQCVVPDDRYTKFPSFHPGGKRIAYLGSRLEPRGGQAAYYQDKGVYVVDLSGKNERQVVSALFFGCRHPVYSPDGRHVAYQSWAKGTNRGIFIAEVSGPPTPADLKAILDHNIR